MMYRLILLLAVLTPTLALAGPPLICWPFQIGDAKSLPWGDANATKPEYDPSGYDTLNATKNDYPIGRLVADTGGLLTIQAPVIVRMETLRRAALYAMKDPAVAEQLMSHFAARAKGSSEALALFDAGYLAETFIQAVRVYKQPNPASGIDGYAWIKKAINIRGGDPEMEFAAALITAGGPSGAHQQHLRNAVAGARDGSLLAKNLPLHFVHRGKNIGELRASLGSR